MTNTPDKRHSTEDVLGEFGFRLVWAVQDHWADVKAYKIEGTGPDGPEFWREGSSHNGDCVTDHNNAEIYLEGFVKWDGCSEFENERIHFCGPDDYRKHFALLKHIYIRATELMGQPAEEPWDEPTPEQPRMQALAEGDPPYAPQEAAKLDDAYNDALLGATVSIHGADRFCYSLRKLIRIVMMQRQCKASEAREIVAAELVIPILREHGPDGPVFVNTELVEGEITDEEKPCIITPPGFNGKIVTP